jgi:preprotein translocase subunit SecE
MPAVPRPGRIGKGKSSPVNAFFQELFHTGIYKRTQGRITRQVTFAAAAIIATLGLWRLNQVLGSTTLLAYAVPGGLLLVAWWVAYRVVNVPAFADFLIAVEAEMNKVSWPTRRELVRSSVVVLVTMFFLAAVLWGFDTFWSLLFRALGVIG